jgi:hypothetical protein
MSRGNGQGDQQKSQRLVGIIVFEQMTAVDFGVVAEPVNLASSTRDSAEALDGQAATFEGYYRLWNDGQD